MHIRNHRLFDPEERIGRPSWYSVDAALQQIEEPDSDSENDGI